MRNVCFYSSRPSISALKIHPEIVFFQDASLDTLFVDFILISYKNYTFWDPFSILWAIKVDFQIVKVAPKTFFSHLRAVDVSQPCIFFYMLVALWLSVGTFLVPIGYLLLHFRYHVQ